MGQRAGNADRLQLVFVIERGREVPGSGRPVDGFIRQLNGGRSGDADWRRGDADSALETPIGAPGMQVLDAARWGATAIREVMTPGRSASGSLGGMCATTRASSEAASGARPDDATKALGSSAGTLSITVRRVSTVVPWRA